MSEEHIPDVSPEIALKFAEIDLQIEAILRALFEDLEEMDIDDVDRTCITHYMRMCFVVGWDAAQEEAARLINEITRRISPSA